MPRALFAALTFHLNWLEGVRGYLPASWDVLWSLSIEEMFYLGFPIACAVVARRSRAVFMVILLTLAAIGPFARAVWTKDNEIWQEKSYFGCMDAIAFGCLAALLADWLMKRKQRIRPGVLTALELFGAAMIALIFVWPPWHWMRFVGRYGLDGTILPVGTCLTMIGMILKGKPGGPWTAPLRWFGRNSYEIYLTHEFIVIWGTMLCVKVGQPGPLPLWYLGIALASAIPGAIAARYYSEPWNVRLRRPIGFGG